MVHYICMLVVRNLQSCLQILFVSSNVRKVVRNTFAFSSNECSVSLTPRLDSHFVRCGIADLHRDSQRVDRFILR